MLHSDDLVLTNAFKERQEKGDALVGGAAVTQNVLEGWTASFLTEAQQIVLEVFDGKAHLFDDHDLRFVLGVGLEHLEGCKEQARIKADRRLDLSVFFAQGAEVHLTLIVIGRTVAQALEVAGELFEKAIGDDLIDEALAWVLFFCFAAPLVLAFFPFSFS